MNITRVELNHFRNIEHAVYNLDKFNCFEAKNHTGKTNTILAIYWLLTGKQLDGSSDDISLKPLTDASSKVSVEITLISDSGREHKLKRTYQEHWAKTRGSEEVTLTGHDTTFYIDDLEQKKVAEAKEEIANILGTHNETFEKVKALDVYQALMNPLYLGQIAEWKDLRQLIVLIIGDVEANEIFEKAPQTLDAKEMLAQYDYKVDKVILYCNQQMESIGKRIIELEAQIDYLKKTVDIPAEELEKLNEEIASKQSLCKKLNNKLDNTDNPLIKEYEKQYQDIKVQLLEMKNKEMSEYNKNRNSLFQQRNDMEDIKNKAYLKYQEKCSDVDKIQTDIRELEIKVDYLNGNINKTRVQIEDLRNEYRVLKNEVFTQIESKVCPHCGAVLNEDELNSHKVKWEEEHQAKIDKCIASGKSYNLELDNLIKNKEALEVQIATLKQALTPKACERDEAKASYDDANNSLNDFINNVLNNDSEFTYSIEYMNLVEKGEMLRKDIEKLKSAPASLDSESQNQINALKVEIDALQLKQGQHFIYLNNQKEASDLEALRKATLRDRIKFETTKEAAVLFNKTKLDILEARLLAHFGNEVKWVLVENNIKEGSWNNVCYPLIVGKTTPYRAGSTSEKVITGIKIIEVIKKELGLPDLPLFIDEIGELDIDSLNYAKSLSNSQILATKVNDSFPKPTLRTI